VILLEGEFKFHRKSFSQDLTTGSIAWAPDGVRG